MFEFLKALYRSKALLLQLTINDFKQKYAGNILGITWAVIQPIFTILIFWFVFQVGFKAKPIDNFPYILWLIAGMIPWFFISEGMMNGAYSIINNAFLVKKVVFRVGLLPIIPLLSALVIHLFFVIFMLGMFIYYGYYPNLYWLQIIYYIFASLILLLGLSWITSSVIVFLRDIGQFVSMIIQFAFWLTPIFWSITMVPERYQWIIKLNPFFYIIEGFRNSLIYNKWFWQEPQMTLYFWVLTGIIFVVGGLTFKGLRPHFSDVL